MYNLILFQNLSVWLKMSLKFIEIFEICLIDRKFVLKVEKPIRNLNYLFSETDKNCFWHLDSDFQVGLFWMSGSLTKILP